MIKRRREDLNVGGGRIVTSPDRHSYCGKSEKVAVIGTSVGAAEDSLACALEYPDLFCAVPLDVKIRMDGVDLLIKQTQTTYHLYVSVSALQSASQADAV